MGDRNFRLSPSVRPDRYVFRLAAFAAERRLEGQGTVHLTLERPERKLVLHGAHLEVKEASVEAGGRQQAARVEADAESQTLAFSFEEELPAGPAALHLRWTGRMHEDLRGMYLAGGVVVTQFEAADARRVFPCFDEPAFKAPWEITVEAPADVKVISNGVLLREEAGTALGGPGFRARVFAPTPRMSSYLVAVVGGNLVSSAPVAPRNVETRTWAMPEKAHLTSFGQECAAAVLPLLEDYFALPYAFGKLDQIGIPDFEAGAMENSGCVTFREIALLVDPERAPLPVRKRVAEVITHELAHQWFGNLVTMKWWDDLWLNEAFATWMAYKIVDQWRPEWRMWDDFENGKAAALQLDSLESTHPIRSEVLNADQATENFDVITYEKGGALLRMIEGYLGADVFREGIRLYMKRHQFENAAADDLWGALAEASGQPVDEVAHAWIGRGGHPLVSLSREGTRVVLRQRRFWADPEKFAAAGEEIWPVPVVLRWADDGGVHEARHLLRGREESLVLPAKGEVRFVHGNRGGAGFYRVQHPAEELAALALHRAQLTPVERSLLVADAWALFRAGSGSLASVLDLVEAFGSDDDYVVLGEIVSRLDVVERRIADDELRPMLRRVVERLLSPKLEEIGWDAGPQEKDAERLRRAAVVRAVALVARQQEAMEEASRRLLGTAGAGALDPNLLDAAAVAAARIGDAGAFGWFLERLKDPDPAWRRRALVALASFEEPALARRAIGLLLSDTVPMQDSSTYVLALLSNPATRTEAWALLRQRWPEVQRKVAAPMLLRRVIESLGELADRRGEVEAFLEQQKDALAALPQAIRQTRERLRLDEEIARRGRPELDAWLDRGRER